METKIINKLQLTEALRDHFDFSDQLLSAVVDCVWVNGTLPSPNTSEPVGEASTQINQPCGIKQPCANVGIECDSCSHNGGLSSVNFFEAD